jgi:hypothetical protein
MRNKLLYPLLVTVLLLGACLFFCKNDGKKQSYTVGVISLSDVDQKTFEGFKKEMERYGFAEGENIRYLNDGPAGTIENLDAMVLKQLNEGRPLFCLQHSRHDCRSKRNHQPCNSRRFLPGQRSCGFRHRLQPRISGWHDYRGQAPTWGENAL